MNPRSVLVSLLPALGALACSGTGGPGDLEPSHPSVEKPVPSESSGGSTSGSGSSGTPAAAPSASATSTADPKSAGGTLGPKCTQYLACCDEVAAKNPSMGSACDSTRTQIDEAKAKGVSTSSYESACESAISSMKSAGFCG